MLKKFVFLAFLAFAFFVLNRWGAQPTLGQSARTLEPAAVVRLGERLFRDDRFSSPDGDLMSSCSNCHMFDEDPQGLRAYTDFFIKSWVASRPRDPRRLMLRNSPTILDAADMPRLHFDGEFANLDELVKGTISGRPMGWLPGEEEQALEQARAVVVNDTGKAAEKASIAEGSYTEQFRRAFGVDLKSLTRDETVTLISRAIAEFCRTLTTRKDSAYDKFIAANGLEGKPATGENGTDYARRLLAQVNARESKGTLKLTKGFDAAALQGLKIFFRSESGNCAACHAPPQFTDYSFRNIGISQREYDSFHGEGKFASLFIPNAADARRPAPQFREPSSKAKPGEVDLGFWNFVDLKTSPQRRAGESDDHLLQRMIATFKTPTLRNLKYTQPYFHNGALHTLEETLSEKIELSKMARAGRLREADEEMAKVTITSSDIPPLIAFLNSLNEDLKRNPYGRR